MRIIDNTVDQCFFVEDKDKLLQFCRNVEPNTINDECFIRFFGNITSGVPAIKAWFTFNDGSLKKFVEDLTSSKIESVYTYKDDFDCDGYSGKLTATKTEDNEILLRKFANDELVWEVTVSNVKTFLKELKSLYEVKI